MDVCGVRIRVHIRLEFVHSKEGQKSLAALASVPLGVVFRTVWNDLGEIFVRLRRQFIVALSIVVVLGIISSTPAIPRNPVVSEAFSLISMIAMLPFEIAVFRLLILDEAATGYQFALSTVRFRRMLGWTLAFWALTTMPALTGGLPASQAGRTIVAIAMLVLFAILIVVMLRIVILLPAIAVDAPGASIGNVFADTRDHLGFILKAYLAVMLLFLLTLMLATVLLGLGGGFSVLGRSGNAVAVGAIFTALGFLGVIPVMIVQARLFMRIGDRVKGGAESAGGE